MTVTTNMVAAAGGLSAVLALGAADEALNPPARHLVVAHLSYDAVAGTFTQEVGPIEGEAMSATWSVQIGRVINGVTQQLCAGSSASISLYTGQPWGPGIYDGTRDTYSVDDWVGSECPALQPGDIAQAAWEYHNSHGLKQSTSVIYVVGGDHGL